MTTIQEQTIEQESMKRDFYKLFINGEQVESSKWRNEQKSIILRQVN